MPNSAIFLDLDGTLLTSKLTIPTESKLQTRALPHGSRVVICTGRSSASARKMAVELDPSRGDIIACNGGVIMNQTGEVTHVGGQFRPSEVSALVKLVGKYPNIQIGFYTPTRWYVTAQHTDLSTQLERYDGPAKTVTSHNDIEEPIIKILVSSGQPEILQQLRDLPELSAFDCFFTYANLFEIMPTGVSKGAAVAWFLAEHNIPHHAAFAVGDGDNDSSMFQEVGTSFAPMNASERIQKLADHIVAHHDCGGVVEALRFITKELRHK